MSIVFRNIFLQAAGSFLLILLSLSGIVWIALALRQLNIVTTQGQDAWLLFKMTTLALPNLMATIAPFSFLIAALQTLNRLNSDSELIVLTAAGRTVWTAGRPILALGLLIAVAVTGINHFAQPWCLQQLRKYVLQVRADLLTQVIQPGRFSSPEPNLTFHIRDRSSDGDLIGLVMHDTRDAKQAQSYLAERGIIMQQDGSAYLIMVNGHILRRRAGDDPPEIIVFDRYAVDLDRFEKRATDSTDLKPRERYYSQLRYPEKTSGYYKESPGQFRSELHERFASPLYPIAFAFLAIAFVGRARSIRQSSMRGLVLAFLLAVGFRLGGFAMNNIVTARESAVPILYALPSAAILLSLFVIWHHRRQPLARSGPLQQLLTSIKDRLGDVFQRPAAGTVVASGGWRGGSAQ